MELSSIGQFTIAMLSIINPIGAIPVFLAMTAELTNSQRLHMTKACAITVFITISVSLIGGHVILQFFGISVASFTIGGGILIFTMALSMIKAQNVEAKLTQKEMSTSSIKEIGIVPLAIPLLSGPGAISTSIIYAKKFSTTYEWVLAFTLIAIISLIVYLVLSRANLIREKIGDLGVNVLTRIMGLILLAMAIEMMLGGVKEIIPILKG